MAANKLIYFKKSLASSKLANDERDYYYQYVHTMINVFMDALTLFIDESETTKSPLKFVNDNSAQSKRVLAEHQQELVAGRSVDLEHDGIVVAVVVVAKAASQL